jgi:dTDP-L-rhamnose 4-epimerase
VKRILVTGGAGFIGSHLVDSLLERGHQVRVCDSLVPQVHGADVVWPTRLSRDVEFNKADVRDADAMKKALKDIDVVFHFAAEVGVGQSMYDIVRYTDANATGTAALLEIIANGRYSVQKMIVASSMSVYGEGAYQCPTCGEVYPTLRTEGQLQARDWEMHCPACGGGVASTPTDEDKPVLPTSVYAVSKLTQELMALSVGAGYKVPTVALRFFNVYGPGQALSNPYTGVMAIFSSRLLNGNPPLIYEDGLQTRDFTHVSDIVQANLLAMEKDEANYQVFNVGTGRPVTVKEVAILLAKELGLDIQPQLLNKFRVGDIRHCYADISKISAELGFAPRISIEEGISELVAWVREQESTDLVERAHLEIESHGLTV